MPTYQCIAAEGLLDADRKAALASAITSAHAEVTGAPAYFAQVVFQPVPMGDHFIGGQPLNHDHLFIYGRIRSGRSALDRAALIERLVKDAAVAASLPKFSVWVYIHELPARAMAEFGHILPEPGEEPTWTAALPASDRDRMMSIAKGA